MYGWLAAAYPTTPPPWQAIVDVRRDSLIMMVDRIVTNFEVEVMHFRW
jgi:hypothetical protein